MSSTEVKKARKFLFGQMIDILVNIILLIVIFHSAANENWPKAIFFLLILTIESKKDVLTNAVRRKEKNVTI